MVAGIVVMVGGNQQPAAQQNMMFGGAQLKPLSVVVSAFREGGQPARRHERFIKVVDGFDTSASERVRPKRRRKICL